MRTPHGPLFKLSEVMMALAFALAFIVIASLQIVF